MNHSLLLCLASLMLIAPCWSMNAMQVSSLKNLASTYLATHRGNYDVETLPDELKHEVASAIKAHMHNRLVQNTECINSNEVPKIVIRHKGAIAQDYGWSDSTMFAWQYPESDFFLKTDLQTGTLTLLPEGKLLKDASLLMKNTSSHYIACIAQGNNHLELLKVPRQDANRALEFSASRGLNHGLITHILPTKNDAPFVRVCGINGNGQHYSMLISLAQEKKFMWLPNDNYALYVSPPHNGQYSTFMSFYNPFNKQYKLYDLSSGTIELLTRGTALPQLNSDGSLMGIASPTNKSFVIIANLKDPSLDDPTWLQLINIRLSERKKKLSALLLEKKGLVPGAVLPHLKKSSSLQHESSL